MTEEVNFMEDLKKYNITVTKADNDFDALADKYYKILDDVIEIFKIEDLSLEESIIILDAITTSLTDLKRRSYEDIREAF